ncbi:MAG: methylmalonyl-CoA epimerase [Planctomycetes bacterium]|nr:methylmalonyl-CoA epimerase [Planctomycetota bacterium]
MKMSCLDHVGIAVSNADTATALYEGLLGLPIAARETLESMNLKVVKVKAGETTLEFLEPLPGETVISKFLAARGEGLHHLCFEVDDVDAATAEATSKGYEPVWPHPRPGSGGRRVQFLKPKRTGGVLIEFIQR